MKEINPYSNICIQISNISNTESGDWVKQQYTGTKVVSNNIRNFMLTCVEMSVYKKLRFASRIKTL